jgi:hypothetical protein
VPVTSKPLWQRWLHTLVSGMCGRGNSCAYERHGEIKQKIDYRSQESADKARVKLGKKFGREFDAYQCWFCRGWHVGNAHNLTLLKFCNIVRIFVIQRKRTGNKARPWEGV